MTAIRLAAILFTAALAAPAPGQSVNYLFSPSPESSDGGVREINLRPNVSRPLFLWVQNLQNERRSLTVVLDGAGVPLSGRVDTPAYDKEAPDAKNKGWVLVALKAPPPPATPPAATPPAAAPPANPAAPVAPPDPPGTLLKLKDGKPILKLRITTENAQDAKKPLQLLDDAVTLNFAMPATYLSAPKPKYEQDKLDKSRNLTATVLPAKERKGEPPCPLTLTFPTQDGLTGTPEEGSFRRVLPLNQTTTGVTLSAKKLAVNANSGDNGKFYVGADGLPRIFAYQPVWSRPSADASVPVDNTAAVRLYLEAGSKPLTRFVAAPTDALKVRVEADAVEEGDQIEVGIKREGTGDLEADEKEVKFAYDLTYWLAAGDDGLIFSTRCRDWVLPLDTRGLRGPHDLRARLLNKSGTEKAKLANFATVIFDDSLPRLELLPLPGRHVRGTPLPVRARALPGPTKITKVQFVYGEPGPDGKLPADAPKAEGIPGANNVWSADLNLPADVKKGTAFVSVVAETETGTKNAQTQKIELVDAPKPKEAGPPTPPPTTGTVVGKIVLGTRPQPGIQVMLKDSDGKEKANGETNDKGEFKIENVPPGNYRVTAAKADSGTGTKGNAPVRVEAGKTSTANVTLSRKP